MAGCSGSSCAALGLTLICWASVSRAYRPFDGTDADVLGA